MITEKQMAGRAASTGEAWLDRETVKGYGETHED